MRSELASFPGSCGMGTRLGVSPHRKRMEDRLTINKEYAARYVKRKQAEELSKLRDKYGTEYLDSESSTSEEEDDDAEGVTPQVEREFLRTLSLVRSRDPTIYQENTTFYSAQVPSVKQQIKKPQRPMFLKDYERKRLLERGSLADVSDSDEEEEEETTLPPSYSEQQQMLKQSFKEAAANLDGNSDFLSLRVKTEEEEEEEEREYARWLKGQPATIAKEEAKDMAALHHHWTDPNLPSDEAFLRDYILNRGYIDKETDRIPTYNELVADSDQPSDSEDEEALDKQEEFERKFNFRFEEPEGDMIATYPREVSGSVRREDDTRKMKRKEREERKTREKEKKREELKRLKNLKKQEIMDKLEQLKEVTGNPSVGFREEDLEADFDPAHYDEVMSRVFNDQYDAMQVDTEKPVFSDSEDEWELSDEELNCEDREFNMDAEYDGIELLLPKKRKRTGFAAVKSKSTFDPSQRSFKEYLEDYYQLDYEDMIGDLPCRFKYRSVVPNDFGISTDEILACTDKELNCWASLKKTVQYRTEEEEERDRKKYRKKARERKRKYRILTSLKDQSAAEQDHHGFSSADKKPRVKNSSSRPRHKKCGKELSSARLKSYGLGKKRKRKK